MERKKITCTNISSITESKSFAEQEYIVLSICPWPNSEKSIYLPQ